MRALLLELRENNIEITEDELKKKIKTIKTVYQQELNKITKSAKSGAGTDDLYKPKLIWFSDASFLKEVSGTRKRKSTVSKHYIFIKRFNYI